ncbi:MAG: isoprenylcysteine carboxylmethyltransferase family protein [Candidatus Korobacteraceae bacterium]
MTLSMLWRVLFWGWFASEILVGVATRTKRSSGPVRDRGSLLMLWLVISAAVTACEWISQALPESMFGGTHWLKVVAAIMIVVGLGVRWTAIIALGKSFSSNVAIRESQKLYREGLYRFVRHPSYLGLLLVFVAIGLHSRNWIAFAVVLVPTTAAVLYRIHVEELALREAFGDEYAEYSRTTARLIPGVY